MVDLTVAKLSTTVESGPYVVPSSLIRRYTQIYMTSPSGNSSTHINLR